MRALQELAGYLARTGRLAAADRETLLLLGLMSLHEMGVADWEALSDDARDKLLANSAVFQGRPASLSDHADYDYDYGDRDYRYEDLDPDETERHSEPPSRSGKRPRTAPTLPYWAEVLRPWTAAVTAAAPLPMSTGDVAARREEIVAALATGRLDLTRLAVWCVEFPLAVFAQSETDEDLAFVALGLLAPCPWLRTLAPPNGGQALRAVRALLHQPDDDVVKYRWALRDPDVAVAVEARRCQLRTLSAIAALIAEEPHLAGPSVARAEHGVGTLALALAHRWAGHARTSWPADSRFADTMRGLIDLPMAVLTGWALAEEIARRHPAMAAEEAPDFVALYPSDIPPRALGAWVGNTPVRCLGVGRGFGRISRAQGLR